MPKVNEKTITRSRTRAHRAFPTPRLSEDVISFSECRNNLAACLKRVGETHRLIFITQNGRPTSFIGNIEDWDNFVETQELLEDVRVAELMARTADTEPSEHNQCQIEQQDEPVHREGRLACGECLQGCAHCYVR